jgi:2-methylcitrate dehydratase PrpD
MALLDGTITPRMMEEKRFRDDDVRALMARCTIELPEEFAQLAPATRCCRLTAKRKSGETVVAEYRRSLDDDIADSGWTQAVDKFTTLTRELLLAKAREELIERVANVEREQRVDSIIRLTALA